MQRRLRFGDVRFFIVTEHGEDWECRPASRDQSEEDEQEKHNGAASARQASVQAREKGREDGKKGDREQRTFGDRQITSLIGAEPS